MPRPTLLYYHYLKQGLDIWDVKFLGIQKKKISAELEESAVGRPVIGYRCQSNNEEFSTDRFCGTVVGTWELKKRRKGQSKGYHVLTLTSLKIS